MNTVFNNLCKITDSQSKPRKLEPLPSPYFSPKGSVGWLLLLTKLRLMTARGLSVRSRSVTVYQKQRENKRNHLAAIGYGLGSQPKCVISLASKTKVPGPLASTPALPRNPLSRRSVSVNYIHGSSKRQPNHLDGGGHYHYVYYTRRHRAQILGSSHTLEKNPRNY